MQKETYSQRENYQTDIRRQAREERLKKNRNLEDNQTQNQDQPIDKTSHIKDPELKKLIQTYCSQNYTLNDLPNLCQHVFSNDINGIHYGVIGVRKILSVPPIQQIIDANLIPQLIKFMEFEQYPQIQLEAAWALTNVASGTSIQTQTIIDKGGIPLFVKLLESQYHIVNEQAVWALGNIAGDSSNYRYKKQQFAKLLINFYLQNLQSKKLKFIINNLIRDLILQNQGLDKLCILIMNTNSKQIVKHGSWAISNLCRGKPLPQFAYTKVSIPVFIKMISNETDLEILTDCLWALSYLTDGDDQRIQIFVDLHIMYGLQKALTSNQVQILIPAIRCIGNLATGCDKFVDYILQQPNILDQLYQQLFNPKQSVRRETCWTISNMTAGNQDQVRIFVQEKKIIQQIFEMAENENPEVKKEAIWALSNCTQKGYQEDIIHFINGGIMHLIVSNLDSQDIKINLICLDCLNNLLESGQKLLQDNKNPFKEMFFNENGADKLQNLQNNQNQEIYQKSYDIIQKYFDVEDPIESMF